MGKPKVKRWTDKGKVFSGEDSKQMWADINRASTVPELRDALYHVCCRLQKYEARIDRLMREEAARAR